MNTELPVDRGRRWYGRPWVRTALVAGFFAALFVVNAHQLALSPHAAIGHHGDAYFSVWRLAWVAHQLRADPLHIFDANIFYPERRTLAYSDAMLLPGVAAAPLAWVGIGPLLVYNLVLFAAFVLNGIAAYLLVQRLTGSSAAGMLGGVIFAFAPYRFDHFDHLELQMSFWMPLAALAWHRAVERQTRRGYLGVAGLAAGQVLSCIYFGVFLLTWLGAMTALWFVRAPLKALRVGALILLPAVAVLALYSIPYVQNREQVGDRSRSMVTGYSAKLANYASAPRNSRLYNWTAPLGAHERHLFPGLIAVMLAAVSLWPALDRVRLVHAGGLLFALLLTLGFNGPIYGVLYEWVLPFRGLRVPARAAVLVLLGIAVLAGFGLARLARSVRPRLATGLATAAIALASIEYLAKPGIVKVNTQVSEWYAVLRDIPDAVVFEWPVTVPWRLWNMVDVTYMYRSTHHWRPLVNGYSGYYPRSYLELLMRMRSFPDTGTLGYLQRLGVTVLIIHEIPESPTLHSRALERLVRDHDVSLLAEGLDAGRRITFFRLAPPRTE